MAAIIQVNLVKAAKKSGGDKYESIDGKFTPYIPQDISRPDKGAPISSFTITFQPT